MNNSKDQCLLDVALLEFALLPAWGGHDERRLGYDTPMYEGDIMRLHA